jgi:hypothetical protein
MYQNSHPVKTEEDKYIEQFFYPCNEVYGIKSADLMRTDYSNIYYKDGVPCDLSKLSHKELHDFSTHIR